jgi:hypothetical protein
MLFVDAVKRSHEADEPVAGPGLRKIAVVDNNLLENKCLGIKLSEQCP